MPVLPALQRLLRIRELEEEQSRIALETVLGELNRLKTAIAGTAVRERAGRSLVASSIRSGNLTDRVAGLQELRGAKDLASALSKKLATAESEAARLRERFLATRVQRRQTESLIAESKCRSEIQEERRSQQALDDLNRARSRRQRDNRDAL